jgi:hypothetical protein
MLFPSSLRDIVPAFHGCFHAVELFVIYGLGEVLLWTFLDNMPTGLTIGYRQVTPSIFTSNNMHELLPYLFMNINMEGVGQYAHGGYVCCGNGWER